MEPDPSVLRRPAPPPPSWGERGRTVRRALWERAVGWIRWVGPGRIVTGCLAAGGAVLVGWWLVAAPPPPIEDSLPRATSEVDQAAGEPAPVVAAPATTVAMEVVVHVAGAVGVPGVYSLPAGARVVDAITAAGGATTEAETSAINLAAVLVDGQKVMVPRPGEVVPDDPGPAVPTGPLSLATATAEQLDALPGIGPVLAEAILRWRTDNGGFASVDELTDVPGIGPSLLERLRDLVTT